MGRTHLRTLMRSRAASLVLRTLIEWRRDRCMEMGAALAYYFLFSMFPVLLTIVGIAGFLLGPEREFGKYIFSLADNLLPQGAYAVLDDHLRHLNERSLEAGSVGGVLMLLSATTVFSVLGHSVDIIWKVGREKVDDDLMGSLARAASRKVVAFLVVIGTAVLLLLSLGLEISAEFIAAVPDRVSALLPSLAGHHSLLLGTLRGGGALLLLFLALLLLLVNLPSTPVLVRDAVPASLMGTAVLTAMQQLVHRNVIHLGSEFRSYGAIGGVMVLMLWVFLVFQVFLLSCEFAYVYSHLYGSRRHHEMPN